MKMTMTQKILAAHAGLNEVTAGQLINAKLDIVLGNDITTPVAIHEFKKAGFTDVFDKDRVTIVLDHFVPNKDIKAAEQSKTCREFACSHCVSHFYDVGKMGIEHALLPEQGIVTAGDCIIGADSHTCTYGALGTFSTGVGSTDMAAGMATGMAWFKVPSAIKFNLTGKLPENCSGKDVILTIIGMIGVDGAHKLKIRHGNTVRQIEVVLFKDIQNLIRLQFLVLVVGNILAQIAEVLAHFRRQVIAVRLLQQITDAALAGLGVDADNVCVVRSEYL